MQHSVCFVIKLQAFRPYWSTSIFLCVICEPVSWWLWTVSWFPPKVNNKNLCYIKIHNDLDSKLSIIRISYSFDLKIWNSDWTKGHTCFPEFLKFLTSRTCSTYSAFPPNFSTPRKIDNLLVVSVVNRENLIVSVPFLVQNMSFVSRVSVVRQLTIFLPKRQNRKFAKNLENKYDQTVSILLMI